VVFPIKRQTTNHITTIQTDKFKTTVIKVSFKTRLSRETITERIMLANVLRNSCLKYPTKKQLSAHLADLYGASFSVSARKQGKIHAISFYVSVANEKFLKSAPPLFESALKTLSEILMCPKMQNGSFDKSVVNLEKRLMKEDIESIFDDKTSYALKTMVRVMCENELFGITGDGYIEDLPKITAQTLVKTYESMLENDQLSIVVLGDNEHEEVLKLFNDNFDFKTNEREELCAIDFEEKELTQVVTFKEEQLINQTKLNIGYRTSVRITDPEYFAMLVFNGVFGAFSHSKLFVNVREKESLCYYCSSQVDNFKGIMFVYSGLDLAQVPKAIKIIDKQLDDVRNGLVTDEELFLAKKSIVNAKRESLDSNSGMLSDLEMSGILGIDSEEFINRVNSVTVDQIKNIALNIKKDTVFTLEPCAKEVSL